MLHCHYLPAVEFTGTTDLRNIYATYGKSCSLPYCSSQWGQEIAIFGRGMRHKLVTCFKSSRFNPCFG